MAIYDDVHFVHPIEDVDGNIMTYVSSNPAFTFVVTDLIPDLAQGYLEFTHKDNEYWVPNSNIKYIRSYDVKE